MRCEGRDLKLVQSRSFAEMLDVTIHKYQNRAIETVEVIEELIRLAKEMREADKRGEDLGLTDAEIAFPFKIRGTGHRREKEWI